jgi:hypothetical protein
MDGPGLDNMNVPDGSVQPKLQFTMFFPTANFFQVLRVNQASLDLVAEFGVDPDDNGLDPGDQAGQRIRPRAAG